MKKKTIKRSTSSAVPSEVIQKQHQKANTQVVLIDQERFADEASIDLVDVTAEKVKPGRPKKVSPNRAHQLVASSNKVFFQEAERKTPTADEIEIELHSIHLCREELESILSSSAKHQPNVRYFTGRVSRIGQAVHQYRVGNKLVGCADIGVISHVTVTVDSLIAVSSADYNDFCSLAALPVTLVPVYYALSELATLNAEEKLLIIGLDSEFASSVTNIGAVLGANVIAASSKLDLKQAETLFQSNVLNIESIDFIERIKEMTGGRGADVIVNLSTKRFHHSLDVLAPFGRYIDILPNNNQLNKTPSRSLKLFKEMVEIINYVHFDPAQFVHEQPKLFRSLLQKSLVLKHQGKLKLAPVKQFSSDQIQLAFSDHAKNGALERCILKFRDRPVVSIYPRPELVYFPRQELLEEGREVSGHVANSA